MNNKKDIFEKIAEAKEEVLLGDVVKVLRALNEDIDDVIEVNSKSLNYDNKNVEGRISSTGAFAPKIFQ